METKKETGQEKNLQDDLKDSAHKIWLAGLGALAAAEEEGTKLFSRLVDRGRDFESRGKVEVDKAKDKAREARDKARDRAESAWENVGSKVDEAVTAALHRLGVPTRDEIRTLTQRVEELTAKVELLRPRVTPATAQPGTPMMSATGRATGGDKPAGAKSGKGSSKVV